MDDYGALQSLLKEHNISQPTIYDIHRAVIEIRRSKLPDPTLLGNAGSFLKILKSKGLILKNKGTISGHAFLPRKRRMGENSRWLAYRAMWLERKAERRCRVL